MPVVVFGQQDSERLSRHGVVRTVQRESEMQEAGRDFNLSYDLPVSELASRNVCSSGSIRFQTSAHLGT